MPPSAPPSVPLAASHDVPSHCAHAALDPVRAPILDLAGVAHGFYARSGGVSEGLYAGLNVGAGSNDDPAKVRENRRRVARDLGTDHDDVVTPYQIHSAAVHVATGPFPTDIREKPRCDAVVTAKRGLPIGVVTADCGPILFADGEAGVVGAAHAGWKGALGGVAEATVAAMEALGARRERVRAALGPTISRDAYEVGPEFVTRFPPADRERWFRPSGREGHALFDLPGYTLARLAALGVRAAWTGQCTYADEGRFSFRRATHRAEPDYGRQMAAIAFMG